MQHYTIETGHCRDSERSEVSSEAIAAVTPMLVNGEHTMPHPFGAYRLTVTIGGATLAATVSSANGPLVSTVVALDADGLANALRVTGTIPAVELKPPCILVQTYPALALDHEAIGWAGDFERVLGWAWHEAVPF